MNAIDPSVDAFLATHSRAYMYVKEAEGGVRGWPMTARYAHGIYVMTTYRKSPKMKHLGTAARMTLLVTQDGDDLPAEYAVVEGMLRLTPIDASNADAVIARMRAGQPVENDHYRERMMEGKRLLIEVIVDRAERFRLDAEGLP